MVNFLTVRKFNSSEQVYYSDADEFFFNRRKFNDAPAVTSVVNIPPQVDNMIPDQVTVEDETWDFIFDEDTFSDPDMAPNPNLSYTATKGDDSPLPSWLTFTGATRRFVGTPLNEDVGVLEIKVIADDGLAEITDTFQLEIINVNDGPTVDQGIQDQNSVADTDFNFQFPADAFDDVDLDALTYIARLSNGDELPNWLTFDSATRTFSGIPSAEDIGNLEIEVIADDGNT